MWSNNEAYINALALLEEKKQCPPRSALREAFEQAKKGDQAHREHQRGVGRKA